MSVRANFPSEDRPPRVGEWPRILLEALGVCGLALALALIANAVSPRGLALTRNYFPSAASPQPGPGSDAAPSSLHTSAASNARLRLEKKGLRAVETAAVLELFRDPRYEQELIVFIDARNELHYREGHIPGAYLFDRYYPEQYLPFVLPVCLTAGKVVVYCSGGDCEDSEFAALALRDAGVPAERLTVYTAGFSEWSARNLPVESGRGKRGE